jgi:hypothetical protein
MPEKPFKEKKTPKDRKTSTAFGKSEVEDKLRQENMDILEKLKSLGDKMLDPKAEKNEGKDTKDINEKLSKDSKDSKDNKFEKSEKERKDIVKEVEVGVFQGVNPPDPQIERRIAALENLVGQLVHFIPAESRPDLSRGALKQEPDQQDKSGKPA